MTDALATRELGKQYGRLWALRDCTVTIPAGRVVGIVGPNGAGKTTLLHLADGLLRPTCGAIEVLGTRPGGATDHLARVGFVAQDTPVYDRFSVADHLRLGAWLNPKWDETLGMQRVRLLGLDPLRKAGRLSGGQRAQLALTLAIAKRPELLILDEPVASLDPLARREFHQSLMEVVAENGVTVLLSSHLVTDLERVCDYLVVMVASKPRLYGEVDVLLRSHRLLTGPRRSTSEMPASQHVIAYSHRGRQSSFLVRTDEPIFDPSWTVDEVGLEDLALAYMTNPERPSAAHHTALEMVR